MLHPILDVSKISFHWVEGFKEDNWYTVRFNLYAQFSFCVILVRGGLPLANYRIAQKFRGSKFSRIHCTALNTPRPYFYERDVLKFYLTRALELSFIDLAAAVNTRNLEGCLLSTFKRF